PARRTFRYHRQRKPVKRVLDMRVSRVARNAAGIVAETELAQRFEHRAAGRKIGRAKPEDFIAGEIAPACRFVRDAVDLPGVDENLRKCAMLRPPCIGIPALSIEMAAAMARDLMAFALREPHVAQSFGHLAWRGGKA